MHGSAQGFAAANAGIGYNSELKSDCRQFLHSLAISNLVAEFVRAQAGNIEHEHGFGMMGKAAQGYRFKPAVVEVARKFANLGIVYLDSFGRARNHNASCCSGIPAEDW